MPLKAIVLEAQLTRFTTRADRSLSFSGVTPELETAEKVALMEMQGLNVRLLVEPMDFDVSAKVEVKNKLETKSPSQRLRDVLFVLWKQSGEQGAFESFYRDGMHNFIESVKSKLTPE